MTWTSMLQELFDFQSMIELLDWDQSTYMPVKGVQARSRQMALLERLRHQRLLSNQLREELEKYKQKVNASPEEKAIIRILSQEMDRAKRIPPALIERFSALRTETTQHWVRARAKDDFALVAPYLEQMVEATREYASYFPEAEHPADPLIHLRDEGIDVKQLRPLFANLKKRLIVLLKQIKEAPEIERDFLDLHYPRKQQLFFIDEVLSALGFDRQRARQDFSPHPFMTKIAHHDIRITTRINESELTEGLFSSIHETGHALYELGFREELEGTPLHNGVSSGMHESQSRLYENIVGRSRAFWEHFFPLLQRYFPTQLGHVSCNQFYRAINAVRPSLIRTEADEVTYNLHVIIRFELEMALLQGDLTVAELPQAWRDQYQQTLGVTPQSDREGVLQDIHWYSDYVAGAFQGYTLGNLCSAQIFGAAQKALPQLAEEMTRGEFTTLGTWLQENMYRWGRTWTAEELLQRITGQSWSIEPFMMYLENKYSEIYKLD